MATLPFSEMPRQLNRRAAEIGRNSDIIVRRVANEIGTRLVDLTPVDTGKARSNWIPSIGSPSVQNIPPYRPYPKFSQAGGLARRERANFTAAVSRIRSVVSTWTHRTGGPIFFTNAVRSVFWQGRNTTRFQVPYLYNLVTGNPPPGYSKTPWSTQSPIQWIRLAVLSAIASIPHIRLIGR